MHGIALLGPPGTGKTYKLLERAAEAVTAHGPERVAYLSFTNAAVNEAVERAGYKDVPPFWCTVHALAHRRRTDVSRQLLNRARLREFAVFAGYIRPTDDLKDPMFRELMRFLPYFHEINVNGQSTAAILKRAEASRGLERAANGIMMSVAQLAPKFARWKKDSGVIEFHDMLVEFVERGETPQLDAIFVDEAQDLSAMQWRVVAKLVRESGANLFVVAGDDDQAIHRWAGADVATFQRLVRDNMDEVLVLEQSRRVPRQTYELADQMIRKLKSRLPKNWRPRAEDGQLTFGVPKIQDFMRGQWLVLSRTRRKLYRGHSAWMKNRGIWHEREGRVPVKPELLAAARAWREWQADQSKPTSEFVSYLRVPLTAALGAKRYGDVFMIRDVVRQGSPADIRFMDHCEQRRFNIFQPARIQLDTIHQSKGKERENVWLDHYQPRHLAESMLRTDAEGRHDGDDERRVFYVGLTRAIERCWFGGEMTGTEAFRP